MTLLMISECPIMNPETSVSYDSVLEMLDTSLERPGMTVFAAVATKLQ